VRARLKLLGDIQRQLATDSVNVYLYQLPQFAVGKKQLIEPKAQHVAVDGRDARD